MNILDGNTIWRADNLLDGLTLKNGVISGIPTAKGRYNIPVTVSNSLGSSTKNIRIIAKNKGDCTILKNGVVFENTTFADVVASIQNETALSKYSCSNTQMLIDFVHPKTNAVIEDFPLNFCSFRSFSLEDGSTKKCLILQFANTLWKGFAPFGTNGFNRWKYSQLRKWLNASGSNWFTSSYTADILFPHEWSYTDSGVKGFLSCLPPALAELLLPVKIVTQAFFDDYNEDEAIDDPDYIDGVDADITYDKVFIPSFSEMTVTAGSDEFFPDTVFEGGTWDFYSALSSDADITRDINGETCSIITRSAYLDGTAKILYADSLTHVFPGDVYSANSAPAPAFVLG